MVVTLLIASTSVLGPNCFVVLFDCKSQASEHVVEVAKQRSSDQQDF